LRSNIRAAYAKLTHFSLSVRVDRARCDRAALQYVPDASAAGLDAIRGACRPRATDQNSLGDYGIECQTARIWIRATG
jgi:hypothetical protein